MIRIFQGNTELADGAAGVVRDLRINGRRVVQVEELVRAAAVTVFGRGNRRNEISFAIDTEHDTYLEALEYAFRQNDTRSVKADLVIEFTEGSDTLTARLSGAGWEQVDFEPVDGRTTIEHWRCIGGAITVQVEASGSPSSFALPVILESEINPFEIPAGRTATLNDGEILVVRELEINGALTINGGEVYALA